MFLTPLNSLAIGGVEFVIGGAASCRLRIANPHYRPFVKHAVGQCRGARIPVRWHDGSWPEQSGLAKVFDTQDSWSLRSDEASVWITLSPPSHEEPLWVARFDRRVRRLDLYCRAVPGKGGGRGIIDLPLVYPLDQLVLMYFLAWRQGLLLHAAGMVREGRAYLFAGASGAGKSTISGLLAAARAGRLLSDERMIVRKIGGEIRAFGTPWAGTAGIARDGSAPLAGIFFLKHGKSNRIEQLTDVGAVDRLLPLASIPWYDPETMAPVIAFLKRLAARVPAYEMSFTPDRGAIDLFLEFTKKSS